MQAQEFEQAQCLSKSLCKILRHEADKDNVTVMPDGFAPVQKVLNALRRFGPNPQRADVDLVGKPWQKRIRSCKPRKIVLHNAKQAQVKGIMGNATTTEVEVQ